MSLKNHIARIMTVMLLISVMVSMAGVEGAFEIKINTVQHSAPVNGEMPAGNFPPVNTSPATPAPTLTIQVTPTPAVTPTEIPTPQETVDSPDNGTAINTPGTGQDNFWSFISSMFDRSSVGPGPEVSINPSPNDGTDNNSDNSTDPSPNDGTDNNSDNSTDPSPNDSTDNNSDNGTDPSPNDSTDNNSDNSTDPSPNDSTDNNSDNSTDPSPNDSTDNNSDNSTDPSPNDSTDNNSDNSTDHSPNDGTDNNSDNSTDQSPNDSTDNNSDNSTDHTVPTTVPTTIATTVPTKVPGPNKVSRGNGTISMITTDGGFFGIVSDDGSLYVPGKIDPLFQVDGLRVTYLVLERHDREDPHNWGIPVDLLELVQVGRVIEQRIDGNGTIHYEDLEGGFYGIIADNGSQYLPI